MSNLVWNPPIFAPGLVGLAVAVAALTAVAYALTRRGAGRRLRAVLGILRLSVVLAVLVVLLRPMTVKPTDEPSEKPVFCVLVDGSASMNTRDAGEKTRLEAIRDALAEAAPALANELGRRCELRFYEFSGEVLPTSLPQIAAKAKAEGMETDLGKALTRAVDAWPYRRHAGVLLLSDGRENAGAAERAATYLKSLNVPVWTAPVGAETQTKDIFVSAWLSQNFMFVKQPAVLRVALTQTGYPDGYAKVNLYRNGEYVSSQQIMLKGGNARLEFIVKEDVKGTYPYRVEVEPLEGEADVRNNRRTVFGRVIDEKSRVLVVEGQPSWDSKFMLRALRADPNLQVTALYYINERRPFAIAEKVSAETAEKRVETEGVRLPKTRQEWFQYDCVIFGRNIETALGSEDLSLLKEYLTDRGGSIVFSRGKAYSGERPELAELEPLVWGSESLRNARIALTPEGQTSPIFNFNQPKSPDVIIRELPEMRSVTQVKNEKALSVVLAKTEKGSAPREIAAISYQRYGKGKVMSIGTGGLWQWSFLPERLDQYDDVYERFWGQMLRWLLSDSDFLPGQDISFRSEKYTYRLGEPVRLTIWTRDVPASYQPTVELTPERGEAVRMRPTQEKEGGPYELSFTPDTEGEYVAVLHNNVGEPRQEETRFTVYSDMVEARLVAADPELLQSISDTTGGCPIPLDQLKDLSAKVQEFELAARQRAKPVDVWDNLWVFTFIGGLLAVEWFIRRRSGLV